MTKPYHPSSFLILIFLCFAATSCSESERAKGEAYLYVADDFSEIIVESAPEMSQMAASEKFVVLELDKQQQLPENPRQVSGLMTLEEDRIIFKPHNSLQAGTTYRAVFQFKDQYLERDFYVRNINDQAVAHVVNVYPSQPYLIQNLKRIYIEFSHTMSAGHARKNIHFINDHGDTVRHVFKDDSAEKWFLDGKLLRLDLAPIPFVHGPAWNEALNKRFKLFQQYYLVVENEMRDAEGRKLTNDYQKHFYAHKPYMAPSGNYLLVNTPKASTFDSVRLKSQRPHDIMGMREFIQITDKNGEAVSGEIRIEDYESSWIFTPKTQWKDEEYHLRISTRLEDLAGNTRAYGVVALWQISQTTLISDNHRYLTISKFWPGGMKNNVRDIFQDR